MVRAFFSSCIIHNVCLVNASFWLKTSLNQFYARIGIHAGSCDLVREYLSERSNKLRSVVSQLKHACTNTCFLVAPKARLVIFNAFRQERIQGAQGRHQEFHLGDHSMYHKGTKESRRRPRVSGTGPYRRTRFTILAQVDEQRGNALPRQGSDERVFEMSLKRRMGVENSYQ